MRHATLFSAGILLFTVSLLAGRPDQASQEAGRPTSFALQSADLLKSEFSDVSLFVGIGAARNKDRPNAEAVREDTSDNSALIRPTVLFVDALQATPAAGIDLNWKFYPDLDHMSVFNPAVVDGLRFVLH